MSQAATLLSALTAAEEDDDILVIDHYTRTIGIPSKIKSLGVESDDEVLRLNFKMPRYLGTTDLSKFSIRINYINAAAEEDVYIVTDATVVGSYITFSWLVGPSATAYKGKTKFNVCMVVTNSNSVIQNEYNTSIATLPVLEGLECGERVVSEYSDILQQWENRLFGIGDAEEANLLAYSEEQQQNIANKGIEVLATIPEDYTTTYNLAQDSVRTRANAIVSASRGESIAVNDASDDYLRGLRIFGKTDQVVTTGVQLFDGRKINNSTINGVTITNDGTGVITISGTSTAAFSSNNIIIEGLAPGTYSTSGSIDNHTIFFIRVTDAAGAYTYYRSPNTFTLDGTETEVLGYIYAPQGGITYVNAKIYPMLNAGNTALPWEPYSGAVASPSPDWPQELSNVENPTVSIYGRNLIPYPYAFGETKTAAGVTFTANSDGSIAVSGTPEAYTGVQLVNRMPLGSDVAIALLGDYVNAVLDINVYDADKNSLAGYVSKKELVLYKADFPEGAAVSISVKRNANEVEMSGTVYPIMVAGEVIPTEYEPYIDVQSITATATLPGIPVSQNGNYTDANGQPWICDEIDYKRGVYVQRVNILECDGSESITREEHSDGTYRFVIRFAQPANALEDNVYDGKCNYFAYGHSPIGNNAVDNVMCIWTTGDAYCRYDAIDNADDMATWLAAQYTAGTPVTCIYPLAAPIEIPLTAEEIEAFKEYRSNYPYTTTISDSKAGLELKYNADTKIYLENLPKASDAQIAAAVEDYMINKLNGLTLVDDATGVSYTLKVSNGKLTMEEV